MFSFGAGNSARWSPTRRDTRKKVCFYFDRDFLGSGYDIAPLRASIHSVSVRNGLPVYGDDGKLFGGLPSFIADSLPDHWGNKVFNEWAKIYHISTAITSWRKMPG